MLRGSIALRALIVLRGFIALCALIVLRGFIALRALIVLRGSWGVVGRKAPGGPSCRQKPCLS